jgi:hypothetical protein
MDRFMAYLQERVMARRDENLEQALNIAANCHLTKSMCDHALRRSTRPEIAMADPLYQRLQAAAKDLGLVEPTVESIYNGTFKPTRLHEYLWQLETRRMDEGTYFGLLGGRIPVSYRGTDMVYL